MKISTYYYVVLKTNKILRCDLTSLHFFSLVLLIIALNSKEECRVLNSAPINNQGPLEMDVVHTVKVRLKVVGGTEVRLELCCIVLPLRGGGRVLGRGT